MSRLGKGNTRGLRRLGPSRGGLIAINAITPTPLPPPPWKRWRYKRWIAPEERAKKREAIQEFLRTNELGVYCQDNFGQQRLNLKQRQTLNAHKAQSVQRGRKKKITLPSLKFMAEKADETETS